MKYTAFRPTLMNVVRGIVLLRHYSIRHGLGTILKNFWREYYLVEFERITVMYNVTLPVDGKIPFRSRAFGPYINFVFPIAALVGYVYKSGGKQALPDLEKFLLAIADFYIDAGKVFRSSQTTFKRTGSEWQVTLLRLLDKEKNSAPSLHVIIASFVYFHGVELVRVYAPETVERSTSALLRYACRVIDSTLLIKQHCVQDLALAFAVVTFRYASFRPTEQILINGLFTHSRVRISAAVVDEVRQNIRRLYTAITKKGEGIDDIISYLSSLPVNG